MCIVAKFSLCQYMLKIWMSDQHYARCVYFSTVVRLVAAMLAISSLNSFTAWAMETTLVSQRAAFYVANNPVTLQHTREVSASTGCLAAEGGALPMSSKFEYRDQNSF